MSEVTIYTTRFCPFCVRAKALLANKAVDFEEIAVDQDMQKRQEMMEKAGRHTVPQIWVGETHIGSCDELYMLERAGKLDDLLNKDS